MRITQHKWGTPSACNNLCKVHCLQTVINITPCISGLSDLRCNSVIVPGRVGFLPHSCLPTCLVKAADWLEDRALMLCGPRFQKTHPDLQCFWILSSVAAAVPPKVSKTHHPLLQNRWFNLLTVRDAINLIIHAPTDFYPHTVKIDLFYASTRGREIVPRVFVGRGTALKSQWDLLVSLEAMAVAAAIVGVCGIRQWGNFGHHIHGFHGPRSLTVTADSGNGLCGSDIWGIYPRQARVWEPEWRLTTGGRRKPKKRTAH